MDLSVQYKEDEESLVPAKLRCDCCGVKRDYSKNIKSGILNSI